MKSWIDEKIDYLLPLLGGASSKDFLFEPTQKFYENLSEIDLIPSIDDVLRNIDEDRPPFISFDVATDIISKHLGGVIPRIEFHPFSSNTYGPGIAGRIQVGGTSREIQISSDYKEKSMEIGAILAHEISHDVLFSKNITLPDTYENEKLTDLAAVVLGLGKLSLNGMESITTGMMKKLCYLSFSDIVYAYVKVNSINKVPTPNYFTNLTFKASAQVIPVLEKIDANITQSMLETVKNKVSKIQNIRKSMIVYDLTQDNQEWINKYTASLNIEPDDGKIFVELNSLKFKLEFEGMIFSIDILIEDFNERLNSNYNGTSADAVKNTLNFIENFNNRFTRINKETDRFIERLFIGLRVQEKYFPTKSGLVGERFYGLIQEGKIKEALMLAEKDNCGSLMNLGIEFAKKRDLFALIIFNRIIKLNPDNSITYYNRGNIHRDMDKPEKAIDDYTQAIILNPNYVNAISNRGNVYFRLKQYFEANDDYTTVIGLSPDHTAYANRGYSNISLKHYLEAIDDFHIALEINPDDSTASKGLEKAFSQLKEHDGMLVYAKIRIGRFLDKILVMNYLTVDNK